MPFAFLLAPCAPAQNEPTPSRPNLILILCDDLGYGDLGCYGNTTLKTPHVDRLAKEGVRFTDFYCAGAQCTPSRAGLFTGRYPVRFGLTYTLMTDAGVGIPDAEVLLPEALKKQGYATMLAGKWHLGDQPRYHPLRHGFDHFAGLLRGHDTDPREFWQGEKITDKEAPLDTLTRRYTDAATEFIAAQAKAKQPFFLMLAHTYPHTPLTGTYAQAVGEIDDSVGRVLDALKAAGASDNTLIVFSSDNGPAVEKGKNGGSTGPLRAGKFSTFEGGVRVPAIAWMPARFKPKAETQPAILLDWFPTMLALAGAKPPGHAIDGKDLTPVLSGAGKRDGSYFIFYFRDQMQAYRSGDWKLKLGEKPADPPVLFDLSKDAGESKDLAAQHPDVVARLRKSMEATAREMSP